MATVAFDECLHLLQDLCNILDLLQYSSDECIVQSTELILTFCRSQWNRGRHSFTWSTDFTSSLVMQVELAAVCLSVCCDLSV